MRFRRLFSMRRSVPESSQTTLGGDTAVLSSVGLHSGQMCSVKVQPAGSGSGYVFQRTDGESAAPVRATTGAVSSTNLCTTLGVGDSAVSTVEHLLAGLRLAGVDNAHILVSGPEIPILDGSALPWLAALSDPGLVVADPPSTRVILEVRETVKLHGPHGSVLRLSPPSGLDSLAAAAVVEFPDAGPESGLAHQEASVTLSLHDGNKATRSVAAARTFSLESHLAAAAQAGLVQGVNERCGLLYADTSSAVLNAGALDRPPTPNEAAHHKILDLIGDFALFDPGVHFLVGDVSSFQGSHSLNIGLMSLLHSQPSAYELVPANCTRLPD